MKLNLSAKVLFGLFAFFTGLGFFVRSSFFNIQEIKVKAHSKDLKLLVEKHMSKFNGTNMWELEPNDLSSDLVAKFKGIQNVYFQRQWPSVLSVIVEERRAVAQTFVEGTLWLLDVHGVPFIKKVSNYPLYWPMPEDKAVLQETLSWMERENPAGVNGLTWDKELGLVVYFEKNMRIVLGRENFSMNWKKAAETVEYLKERNLQSRKIDATYNNRTVVSL